MKKRVQYFLIFFAVYILLIAGLLYSESQVSSSNIKTFGDAIWYSLITLTTVGYGDIYPITAGGRAIGVIFSIGSLVF